MEPKHCVLIVVRKLILLCFIFEERSRPVTFQERADMSFLTSSRGKESGFFGGMGAKATWDVFLLEPNLSRFSLWNHKTTVILLQSPDFFSHNVFSDYPFREYLFRSFQTIFWEHVFSDYVFFRLSFQTMSFQTIFSENVFSDYLFRECLFRLSFQKMSFQTMSFKTMKELILFRISCCTRK